MLYKKIEEYDHDPKLLPQEFAAEHMNENVEEYITNDTREIDQIRDDVARSLVKLR